MRRKIFFTAAAILFCGGLFFFDSFPCRAKECAVEEETRTIRTYPFSEPDPVPILVSRPAIYPYFSFTGYTDVPGDRQWKVVRLENDFIRVLVLPEVGGKVLGAVEKSTGREFIYENGVLKFRRIAMRGPWTSGGVEFNFGLVGHAPSCATPVDYILRKEGDGGVSCVVGAMDLPSRTRWRVVIRVSPGKAFLELNPLWYNPTPFSQSYYCWMNNAEAVGEDLRFFYPGNLVMSHSLTDPPRPWPIDAKGRDLSFYRNNAFGGSKSYFVLGAYEDFFGGYWKDKRFGFGHFALYDDAPGKKMWIWALSRQGAIWENLLTDSSGQYCEPQAGRLFSQSDHEFFQPGRCDAWREILFPFKEIGGLVKASPRGALNVTRGAGEVSLGFCALKSVDDDLVVRCGGREIFRERLSLRPMEVYKKNLELAAGAGPVEVALGRDLRYSDDPAKDRLDRPLFSPPSPQGTAEGLFLAGELLEKKREYGPAMEKYSACIAKEPLHVRALSRLAELWCRRGEFAEARKTAARALAVDRYDPGANYAFGTAALFQGDLGAAREALGWAARSMEFRSSAYRLMARIGFLEGRADLAIEYARRAVTANATDLDAYAIQAAALRHEGRPDEAARVLERLLELDPLDHIARFERFLLDGAPESLEAFRSGIRCELPVETYLETALFYAGLGLSDEAIRVLEEAPAHPMVFLWRAYLRRAESRGGGGSSGKGPESGPERHIPGSPASGRERPPLDKASESGPSPGAAAASVKDLDAGLGLSPRLVFPFRLESIPVLEWVIAKRPDSWKAGYYLGLLYWSKGRKEEARRLFGEASSGADYAPFFVAFGALDPARRPAFLEKALALGEEDWRNFHRLAACLNGEEDFAAALDAARKGVGRFPGKAPLVLDEASALYGLGRFDECLDLLDKVKVLPYEGAWEAHDLFVRAHVGRAMEAMEAGRFAEAEADLAASKAYPEHLGTGRPFDPDFRLQDDLAALCRAEISGDTGEAGKIAARLAADPRFAVMARAARFALPQKAPPNEAARVELDKDTGRLLLHYGGSAIFEGEIRIRTPAGDESLAAAGVPVVERRGGAGTGPTVLFGSAVTRRERGAMEERLEFSLFGAPSGARLALRGRCFTSGEGFPAETFGTAQERFPLIRNAVGPSDNLRNNAVYDRRFDWVLAGPADGSTRIAPPAEQKAGEGRVFAFTVTGRRCSLVFRPRFYQKHKNILFFAPWTYEVWKGPVTGWCSWWAYRDKITGKIAAAAAKVFGEKLRDFGYRYIQIDDGFQADSGGLPAGWLNTNDRFPGGLERLAETIRAQGLEPGIWVNVHFEDEGTLRLHPEWFVKGGDGKPFRGDWIGCGLDGGDREAVDEVVRPLYRELRRQGWAYVKIDALRHLLYDSYYQRRDHFAARGDGALEKAFRAIPAAARAELGRDTYILACWGVLPEVAGIADGCRLGWDGFGPSTLVQYNSWNNVVWRNDPDHVDITPEGEDVIRPVLCSMAGAVLMLSDKVEIYGDDKKIEGTRRASPVPFTLPGQLYDFDPGKTDNLAAGKRSRTGARPGPIDADREGSSCPWWLMEIARPFERWSVLAHFDWKALPAADVPFSGLGLPGDGEYAVYEFFGRKFLGVFRESFPVPAQEAREVRVFAIREVRRRPQVLSTSRHILQGWPDLVACRWDEEELSLSGASEVVKGDPYELVLRVPQEPRAFAFARAAFEDMSPGVVREGEILRVRVVPGRTGRAAWKVRFVKAAGGSDGKD